MLNLKGENSQTIFNFISVAVTSGIAFVTMPLFTRMLGTEQYGYYSIYNSWLNIFVCFMGANVYSSLGTGFYKFNSRYYEFKSSTLVEGLVISFFLMIGMLFLYPIINSLFNYSIILYFILLLQATANFVINLASNGWVYEKKAEKNMFFSIILLFTTSIFSIILLMRWNSVKPLYYGRVLGIAIPQIILALILCLCILKNTFKGYHKEYWKYSFSFGLPMVFHTLSHQVLSQSDRVMMQWFHINGSEIGIYSFFCSFVAILSIILNSLNTSWCPFLYDDLSKKNYEKLNEKVKNYVEIFTILSLGFLFVAREVMRIFANDDYWVGAPIIPILILTIFCTFIYQFAVNYEFFCSKPKIVAIGTILAAIFNFVLNILFIPHLGMYGASYATFISYGLLAFLHIVIVKKWKLEKYPLSFKYVLSGGVVVLVGCLFYFILKDYWYIRWGLGCLCGIYLLIRLYKRKRIF